MCGYRRRTEALGHETGLVAATWAAELAADAARERNAEYLLAARLEQLRDHVTYRRLLPGRVPGPTMRLKPL
ncbi:hypothetical protein M1P56_16775 [Streptomyces sp. HU2014]|uniref:hypothetical protein n=1 Tax=Streptomyces sp. HU2014 TaxID=2939414 RepID=UPI00200BCC20|nr:hypothetical protein [Streptomyces sp. HU2014]UQI45895.1 hypothetical protein M1P56_16775 [Streptomyces sp. HU2014]